MSKRIASIDIVRGLVMIIMALDHVRDLLHVSALTQSPTDLSTTTPALFFSRWITHLCAPTFVFLSGVSVYLASFAKDTAAQRRFLLTRGLWLIVLEFTLINFTLWFDVQFRILMLQVIAAIGVGFIVLSFLLKVSPKVIGILAAVILVSHNLLQFVPPSGSAALNVMRNLFFTPGPQVSGGFMFLVSYPLIPWIAIMLLGYSLGSLFRQQEGYRNKLLLGAGIGALMLFVVLRWTNVYGDPVPWSQQKDALFTVLSFVNVTKYPPSLLFTLLFIGITLLLLRFADKLPALVKRILSVYGSVPLFYYILHLLLIRLAVFIMVFAQGFKWNDLLFGPFQFGRPAAGSGIGLGGVLLVWLAIVALLYPVCKWYSRYKQLHPGKLWLRYV
ncbi:MAG TPA: heparan-alpha-glucosaminide N-acetyltransferase domain-containing protein [Chitinophagaceae bacterium]|nr:heparan-alpha-glucosaminide N-acetyltransferase domain-containing protein [Chitinophagaceae bacterium]